MVKYSGKVREVPVIVSIEWELPKSIVSRRIFNRRPARLCCIEQVATDIVKIPRLGLGVVEKVVLSVEMLGKKILSELEIREIEEDMLMDVKLLELFGVDAVELYLVGWPRKK